MTRWRLVLSITAAAAAAIGVSAQTAPPRPAFTWERAIVTNGAGPRRLAVDVPLLSGTNADLADLRLFDVNGKETPYLLVWPPPIAPAWTPAHVLNVAPLDTPNLKESGFEADLGSTLTVDRFRIDVIAAPFLKRARLEASGDRAHWTVLLAEATLFDLPDEQLRQTELAFTPGPYRYFRITWDDTNSARAPAPRLASARIVASALAPPPPLTIPLTFERRPSEPGRSRYRVRLPGPHLPIVSLAFDLGGGHVMRDVSVYEPRLIGTEAVPVSLGAGRLQRVVQGSLAAASLDLSINAPVEPQLDLVVDDGDNPPLQVQGISATFTEQPWIYFESEGGALVARYGAKPMTAPRYDLEAVRESLRTGINRVAAAGWGDAHPAAPDAAAATAAPAPAAGAPVDASRFNYVRGLPAGDAGLMVLTLDAAVLSHSAGVAGAFRDVRVIDRLDRQVPYLLEAVAEPLSLDLRMTRLTNAHAALGTPLTRATAYRIDWPFDHLPPSRLVITTSGRVFERTLSIGEEREPNRYHRDAWVEGVARVNWAHADQDMPAPPLTVPLPAINTRQLLLVVEEGDNAPLALTSAGLLLPSLRLRFFREQGASLRLVYGSENLPRPQYDIALLAPQLLGVAAREISAGVEPAPQSATSVPVLVSPRLFWVILVLAVIVLLGLIVRLLKEEQPARTPGSA